MTVQIERDEYTPYGQRTVYTHGTLACDIDGDGGLAPGGAMGGGASSMVTG